MGDSNRVRWAFAPQSTIGTAPGGAYTEIRRVSGDLKRPQVTVVSDETRSDRQMGDEIQTGVSAQGSFVARLSYGSFDSLLEGAFASTFTAATTVTAALTVVKSTNTVTMVAAFAGVLAGQWFKISGSAANDGYYKVATRTSDDEVITEINTSLTDVGVAAEASVTIKTDGMLRNGTTVKGFSFEKEHLDLSNQIWLYDFMTVNNFSLSIPNTGLMELNFDLMGVNGSLNASLDQTSLVAANANPLVAGACHIYDIREGSSALGDQVTKIDISLGNNARERRALGTKSPVDIRFGTGDWTGQIEYYYADGVLVAKYMDQTESSNSFRITDSLGNTYILTYHRYKYSGDTPEDGALNGDVMVKLPYRALRHATLDTSVQLDKFDL